MFFLFGCIQGTSSCSPPVPCAPPQKGEVVFSSTVAQSRRDYTLNRRAEDSGLWVMLGMIFICTVTGGLMAVAQLGRHRGRPRREEG